MACTETTLLFKNMHEPYRILKCWIKIRNLSDFTLYLQLVTFSSVIGQIHEMSPHSKINVLVEQRDATLLMNDLYYPLVSSTCFGLSPDHYQEHHLMNCTTRWYVRAIRRV